jgi:DNA-binding NarL/FixJ family response regulator
MDSTAVLARQAETVPQLVIVDLTLSTLDLATLVAQLKTAHDGRSTIVTFGPHVHEGRLAAAVAAGCDEVLSRGQFFAQLDAIVGRFAHSQD